MASPSKRAFLIRVQPEVLTAIERLAAAELRSVNAQIEFLLRDALKRRGMADDPAPDEPKESGERPGRPAPSPGPRRRRPG